MTQQAPDDTPTPPTGGLGGLISAARAGQAEPPQSELNAAKPEPVAPGDSVQPPAS
jgi:hypothetical protein